MSGRRLSAFYRSKSHWQVQVADLAPRMRGVAYVELLTRYATATEPLPITLGKGCDPITGLAASTVLAYCE